MAFAALRPRFAARLPDRLLKFATSTYHGPFSSPERMRRAWNDANRRDSSTLFKVLPALVGGTGRKRGCGRFHRRPGHDPRPGVAQEPLELRRLVDDHPGRCAQPANTTTHNASRNGNDQRLRK